MKLPKFKHTQEAIDFGRAHAHDTAIAEALERAGKAYAEDARRLLKHRAYTDAIKFATKTQLCREAIEALDHPERLTPLERLRFEEAEQMSKSHESRA